MSDTYLDWKTDRIQTEKKLVELYPFLRERGIDGAPNIDSEFPMVCLEIPDGWMALFLQMCSDIKPILEEEGKLNDFYFIQVKEKYNLLRCYSNGAVSDRVEEIIAKYEHMARYICTLCGSPATCETEGYIASFCDDCWKDHYRHEKVEWLAFRPYFVISTLFDERTISFADEWNRYLKDNDYEI